MAVKAQLVLVHASVFSANRRGFSRMQKGESSLYVVLVGIIIDVLWKAWVIRAAVIAKRSIGSDVSISC